MASKPRYQRDIAVERLRILFDEAAQAFPEHPDRSNRYVEIARRIAMKFNLSLPLSAKQHTCAGCYRYLAHGENCAVDAGEETLQITCDACEETFTVPKEDG